MNDSHDIDMPYHPGCKHRYVEHLDHNALIKRLNEIADEIYKLTQLCGDLETRLSDHNTDTEAHRYLRELINATNNRIVTVKETIDNSLSILDNKVDSNYSTLTAADGQLATRLDNVDTEIADIRAIIESTTLDLQDSITSTVNGNKPIIKSITTDNSVILAELPSEHGKFRYGTDETKTVVTYTAGNNSTGIPNYTATLLDENGDTSFPGIVTAPTLRGNADTATLATKATKLNTAITVTIKDASGENLGSSVTTDLSGNITLKVPSVLKDTNITGIANRAHNDATGADIVDTYVHKTSINEEINGIKTFNDVLKCSNIEPKVHTGSSVGSSTVPYENVYATSITSTNANIDNITGTLTGNASTATKLATARKINGTDFDGTTAITTSSWGSARNISIGDASNTNTGAAVSVNGSSDITLKLPSIIKATLVGNASTATKLAVSKKINNTSFDGSKDITTAIWGTARDISITDNTGEHVGTKVSVNGSSDITLKLPSIITATNFYGVASSATKLNNAVTINGTAFNGTANITTAAWGYSRNIQITDSDSSHGGAITAVNGSSDITLKLPSIIKGTLTGNADTATKATQDAAGNTIITTYATKAELATKVNDSDVVHKTGNETIAGVKTFTDGIKIRQIEFSERENAIQAATKHQGLYLLGSNDHDGAELYLDGNTSASDHHGYGNFVLRARDSKTGESCTLNGLPDKTLMWDSRNLIRSVNGIYAGADGNVNLNTATVVGGTTGYVKDNSTGFIIQWGTGKTKRGITYPIAFTSNSSYSICWDLSDSDADHFHIENKTATGCRPGCDYYDRNFTWIAIGY